MRNEIMLEVSARHIHLSKEDADILFGRGYQFIKKKDLSQPGQYSCEERVHVVGSKKELGRVAVLGPLRPATQVEISSTDARSMGIPIAIRESGDVSGTPGCKLIGPCGELELKEGVIVAKRHIHMTPSDAEKLDIKDQQIVSVCIKSPERKTIFGDVVCRVNENFSLAMHIDTDEGNACGGGAFGTILDAELTDKIFE